jgi:hypothetical protein
MKGSVTSEARYDRASAAKGAALASPNSMPPSASPVSCAAFCLASFWPMATERWDECTSIGNAARCARPKNTVAVPSRKPATSTCTYVMCATHPATAMLPTAASRIASQAIMIRLRSYRSATPPAGSGNSR